MYNKNISIFCVWLIHIQSLEQAYDGFNRGAKLPRLDQGGIDRNAAQSPNDPNMYPAM